MIPARFARPPRLAIAAVITAALAVLALAAGALFVPRIAPPAPASPAPARSAAALALDAEPLSPVPHPVGIDPAKRELGERLFHDPRLSADNTVSCASCHALATAGTDGRSRSRGLRGREGLMNTPTVFNAALNFRQHWDGQDPTLEAQIDRPLRSPAEMGSGWPHVVAKLTRDEGYRRQFQAVYGRGLNERDLKDAIAHFERSLATPDSRFDRHLRGEPGALDETELRGYQRFKSYGCVACHQGVAVGGNMFAKLGAMQPYFAADAEAQPPHQGRYAVTRDPEDLHVFKVPSLRNVARTAPYLHDGSVRTLHDAVLLMGLYQLGVRIPEDDIALIERFLHTLTGEYQGRPL